ncbi:MAG: hypothetical protein U0703_12015 [Anaerolineae bacterium]
MPTITLADVVEAADAGDALARYALARSGTYFGMGLAAVINILCPPLIVISGEGVAAGDHRLVRHVRGDEPACFQRFDGERHGRRRPTDDRAWARGAAGMVIGKVFRIAGRLERLVFSNLFQSVKEGFSGESTAGEK